MFKIFQRNREAAVDKAANDALTKRMIEKREELDRRASKALEDALKKGMANAKPK